METQRGITSEHRGHILLEKADLAKLTCLPSNWWYVANEHGDGVQIDFPMKAKPILSWSPKVFVRSTNGSMHVPAKRFPREKIV